MYRDRENRAGLKQRKVSTDMIVICPKQEEEQVTSEQSFLSGSSFTEREKIKEKKKGANTESNKTKDTPMVVLVKPRT